jgi:hypothetical protein
MAYAELLLTGLKAISWVSSHTKKSFVNNTYSDAYRITTGVPQGSVLGPILFLIYVNDIAKSVHNGKVRLFADDTNLFFSFFVKHLLI